ncbi:cytochrome c [Paraburkholderia tropica]|uniref:Mono/diheme cytochrome c family protein n=1 Tax=Paraburkholderia tropica TaxID=92647 RepID=A0ABX5MD91_9BURK|nr:cytochrome c [Paraburkholderia tropica]PXX05842.1 mono/diheme cytochrome c family protein [Paraburkholderia tropica]PZW70884.1 mono/diheme cytochrome c family protein [Paraburkholderia tropica]
MTPVPAPRSNRLARAIASGALTGALIALTSLAACTRHNANAQHDATHATHATQKPAPDAALIALGAQLAKAGDCASCHDSAQHQPYAGGQPVNSPFGAIYASNITPDPVHGIGRYTPAQFADALQRGVAPGGKRLYPAMPWPSFANLQPRDVDALYQYFMYGVTPVPNAVRETQLPFPFNQRWVLAFWRMAFARQGAYTPDARQSAQWNRGAWLVQGLGHCGACHTPRGPAYNEMGYDERSPLYLTGGIADHWYAPNLTGSPGSGLGRWSADDIAAFLHDGHNARAYAFGAMAPVIGASTQYLSDDDVHAIAVYLKSLPAREPSGAYDDARAPRDATMAALRTGTPEHPGAGVYLAFCAKCHGADGRGVGDKAPPLAGSTLALSADTTSMLRLVIEGSESPRTATGGEPHKMPAFRSQLTDAEIAQVASFVRGAWGNQAAPVAPADVTRLREAIDK